MAHGSTGPGEDGPSTTGQNDIRLPGPRLVLARLLVRGSDAATGWVTRLLGQRAAVGRAPTSGAELRALVARSDVLGREERRLIDDVIRAGDRHVRELMVPRNQVVFLDAAGSVAEATRLVRTARHSRFPVVDGSHDDVVGFVHLRDLLIRPDTRDGTAAGATTVGELTRPLHTLPASKGVLAALSEMRRAGDHLALVVDEYGGTAGIVTLEDLIEELVGEIHDEYDATPEALPADGARPTEVEGLLNLNDFAGRAGFELPAGPYDTVGGFVMASLGRLPVVGDEVRVDRWVLRVVALDGRRVSRVGLTPDPQAAPGAAPESVRQQAPVPALEEVTPPRHEAEVGLAVDAMAG